MSLHAAPSPTHAVVKYEGVLSELYRRNKEGGAGSGSQRRPLDGALYQDLADAALLDPGLALLAVDFVVLQVWPGGPGTLGGAGRAFTCRGSNS